MTKRNERTSPRVVKVAAKVLAMRPYALKMESDGGQKIYGFMLDTEDWNQIRALAASCLTQAADKPKRAPAKRRAGQ